MDISPVVKSLLHKEMPFISLTTFCYITPMHLSAFIISVTGKRDLTPKELKLSEITFFIGALHPD